MWVCEWIVSASGLDMNFPPKINKVFQCLSSGSGLGGESSVGAPRRLHKSVHVRWQERTHHGVQRICSQGGTGQGEAGLQQQVRQGLTPCLALKCCLNRKINTATLPLYQSAAEFRLQYEVRCGVHCQPFNTEANASCRGPGRRTPAGRVAVPLWCCSRHRPRAWTQVWWPLERTEHPHCRFFIICVTNRDVLLHWWWELKKCVHSESSVTSKYSASAQNVKICCYHIQNI